MAQVRLTVLVDNEPAPGLRNDWGLSVLVETPGWRALFDADTDPTVLEFNSNKLGVDLRSLDFAVLSHHHHDHYGGFLYVGRARPGLTVYAPPGPMDVLESMGLRPVEVSGPTEVAPGAHTVGPLRAEGLEEQALAVDIRGGGLLLLVGCSHPGVDRLAEAASSGLGMPIHAVLGGFHSPPSSALDRLASVSDTIYPCHCSGDSAKRYMSLRYPERYREARTGSVIEL